MKRKILSTFGLCLLTAGWATAGYQMPVTLSGYTSRSETLTNFPVLVVLSNNVGGSGLNFTTQPFLSTNGWDLRVRDAADTTNLNYEIESWNTNGPCYVWVQMPSLPGNGTGSILAKWGDANESTQLPCTTNGAVWDTNFRGIWHMNQTNATDSTTNRNVGTAGGGVSLATGKVGSGCAFDGVNGKITVPDKASLDFTSPSLTVEAWVRLPVLPGTTEKAILRKETQWSLEFLTSSSIRDLVKTFGGTDGWATGKDRVYTFATNTWYYRSFVYNGANYHHDVNGDVGAAQTVSGTIVAQTAPLYFAFCAGNGAYLQADIDEIRISSAARSTNWLWSTFMNQASNTAFSSYGSVSEFAVGGPLVVNSSIGATNVWTNSAYLNGVLVSTGVADTVWGVLWGTNNPGRVTSDWLGGSSANFGLATGTNLFNTTQASGLAENTTYYYAYWATNAAGTNVAAPTAFTTKGTPAVDNASGATGIGIGTATLNGYLSITGGLPTEVYVYWGADTNAWANTNYFGVRSTGSFSMPVSNLYYGVRYYYRCYAVNPYAGRWAAEATDFLTAPPIGAYSFTTGWRTNAWTGDANSGITNAYTYLVAVKPSTGSGSVTVNGVTFTGNGRTGPNHTISSTPLDFDAGGTPNPTGIGGSSYTLAQKFAYNGNPEMVVVSNLVVGRRYLATFYAYGFDAPGNRYQTFAVSGGPSYYVDQGCFGLSQGNRISYGFDAVASSNTFTITPFVPANTFHMSALSVAQDPMVPATLSVTNTGSSAAAPGAAIFNANVQATGSVFDVWAYWGPTDGTNNPNAWLGSTLVTTLTNAASANVSKTVAGLPPGTTYYTFRIINAVTNYWATPSGSAVVEATADAPKIETRPETNVHTNRATLNGFLTSTGTSTTVVSVYWGSDGDRILTGDWAFTNDFGVCAALPLEGLAYATNVTGLTAGQQYTYRYYAANATTGVWGDAVSFVTWLPPTVDNDGGATAISATSATLRGTVLAGNPNPQAWIYWGTTDGGTDKGSWNQTPLARGVQSGAFSGSVSGLEANRTYYYRCYVSNECGEAWASTSANFNTAAPGLSISDPSVTEGAEGSTTTLVFIVSLSASSAVDVTVDYATSNGTATVADNDYAATAGSLTIPAGSLTGLVSVTVNGNDVRETDETLYVNLANADRATLTDAQGLGTILNDDWSYYVRYGGPYGNGRGDSWSNAMGQISDAWNDLARGPQICFIYIEKTTGSQTYSGIRKTIGTWFLSPININHFGGLTPTDGAAGWTRQEGDTSHVKSIDANLPGLRININDGVGGYYCGQFSIRFDDMMIEGGANEGAVAIVAVGYNSVASFAANRCTFSSGANNTNWPVVAVSPANNYPGETVAANRSEVWLNRVLVQGHGKDQGGVRSLSGTGGNVSGDSVMTFTNSVIIDTGTFGLYAKGNNYGSWVTDVDVNLCHVTIAGVSNAVWFGDAANGADGYNTLTMNRTLIYLNHPTMAVIRSFEIDAARATQVYGNDNAFFGYGTLTNGTDNIGLAGLGAHQVYDAGGNPQLHADGYHLTSASDRRLIDAYTGSGPTEDIDGNLRPLNQGADIGAVEFVSPKGTLILVL